MIEGDTSDPTPPVIELKKEEEIEFRVVLNDNSAESMILLTGLKNIFQKQLPNMPKEYIARLVYDKYEYVEMFILNSFYVEIMRRWP